MLRHKFRLLLMIEVMSACILLLTCFQQEKRICTVLGENIQNQLIETEGYTEYIGEEMELTPGVYRIRLKAHLEEGQSFFCRSQT